MAGAGTSFEICRGELVIRRRVALRRITPLRRGRPPKRFVAVRKKRARPRRGPARCPEYLAWIRTLPCILCAPPTLTRLVLTEAAHTNALGPRGISQKASDFSAIPLCAEHHRKDPDSYHRLGEKRFTLQHRLDLPGLVVDLHLRFKEWTASKKKVDQAV